MDGDKRMRKVAKIASWIFIAAWFLVVMGFVSSASEEVLCNRIEVVLEDTVGNRFVTEADIRAITASSGLSLQGYPLSEINTRKLEHIIEENDYVRNAEVSKEISGELEISVEQRKALVRVMPGGRGGFYLDHEGKVLPLSDRFTPHILLVSGHIPTSGPRADAVLGEIYTFAKYLAGDDFWNDQVVQVYVDSRGEYELIPRVGAHQILFGTMEQWEMKLKNLALLYEQGLSSQGWNTYQTINLKYTNQVICTKR